MTSASVSHLSLMVVSANLKFAFEESLYYTGVAEPGAAEGDALL